MQASMAGRTPTAGLFAEGRDPKSSIVRESMTPEIVYCFEDQDTHEAEELMAQKQIRRLPVLNRAKRLVGAPQSKALTRRRAGTPEP